MMRHVVAALLLSAGICSPALATDRPAVPNFIEETATAGVDTAYEGDWEFMVGGGVAALDCSGDGLADLYLAGGAAPARLYRNVSEVGGALRFQRADAGLELEGVTGAYPIDIDSDDITDLVVLRVGENVLMRGLGGCRFERANEAWGFDGGDAWSTAFAATWERGASWPTIAIGNYIDRKEEGFPWGSCTDNWLHRPATGADRFDAPVALAPSYCALSMLFTDWNRSGTPSLRVSNDREYYKGGQEQLWHIEPGSAPRLYTAEQGWERLRIWGMGIASHDLDADGYPEYFLTSMADNKLQALAGTGGDAPRPAYADTAFAKGVTAHRPYVGDNLRPSTAWHAQFEDVNNDGLVDLFVAKGNVAKMPDFAEKDPNNLLLQRADGTFEEAGDRAGVASVGIGRGAALADLNLDGLLDLVVVNRWQSAQIWRNAGGDIGRWVQLRLEQDGPNRDALGAWIEVRCGDAVLRREVSSGGGHASGQSGWHHFGLGGEENGEIRVVWPDGEAGAWQDFVANGFYVLRRGEAPSTWTPG